MKVNVLQPLKYDPKKPTAKPGSTVDVDLDDEEIDELVKAGAIEDPRPKPKAKGDKAE